MTTAEIKDLIRAYQAGRITLGEVAYAIKVWGGNLDDIMF
jgi:hypothetical protein